MAEEGEGEDDQGEGTHGEEKDGGKAADTEADGLNAGEEETVRAATLAEGDGFVRADAVFAGGNCSFALSGLLSHF